MENPSQWSKPSLHPQWHPSQSPTWHWGQKQITTTILCSSLLSVSLQRLCSSSSLWFCWQKTPLCSLWDCQTIWCLPTRSYVGTFTSKHNLLLSQILHWKSTERGTPPAAICEQEPLLQVLGLQFQNNFASKKPIEVLLLSIQKMEEKCFLIPLCNLKTFNVILHRVIKGSFCVSLFPLKPVISGMLISTDFEANSHLFLPLFSYTGTPLFLIHSLSFQSSDLFLSLCASRVTAKTAPNTRDLLDLKHGHTLWWSRWRPISSSPWRKDITKSRFALLFNGYCDLWDGFSNPSMELLGFRFPRLLFFQNLFSKRGTRRVSALPRNPWETYLSPVLSWTPDAQCLLLTEFKWVVWESTPVHPQPLLKKTQWSAGLHFYSRNCFLFVCLCIFPWWIFIWQCNEQFPILSFFSFLSLLFSLNIVKYFCNQKVFLEWIYCHDSLFSMATLSSGCHEQTQDAM